MTTGREQGGSGLYGAQRLNLSPARILWTDRHFCDSGSNFDITRLGGDFQKG